MAKKITPNTLQGTMGPNFVEARVFEMGHVWRAAPTLDVGIDGEIELRNQDSSMTGQIMKVQCKTLLSTLFHEDKSSVRFTCSREDLEYWLSFTVPVILVLSTSDRKHGWWKDIRAWFDTPEKLNERVILFDREEDSFDSRAASQLWKSAQSRSKGLYVPPLPKPETLLSNAIPVSVVGGTYHIAPTAIPQGELGEALKTFQVRGRCFFVKESFLYSLHDLSAPEYAELCDTGAAEAIPFEDIARTSSPDLRRDCVRLLKLGLSDTLYPRSVRHSPAEKMHFMLSALDEEGEKLSYQGLRKTTSRDRVRRYAKKGTDDVSYYKHNAFRSDWLEVGGVWHLLLDPDHYYSTDGRFPHPRSASLRSGLKKRELPSSVRGSFHMWAEFLRQGNLFGSAGSLLEFDKPLTFQSAVSIDEATWHRKPVEVSEEQIEEETDDAQLAWEFDV